MQVANGSLTLINVHTNTPSVFWNGQKVENIKRIHIHSDEDESRVKLVVAGTQDAIYAEMSEAGITIKKVV